MKFWKLMNFLLLIAFSSQALSQSVEIMHMSDGDLVDINGFMISARLDGLDAFDDGKFYATVWVYEQTQISQRTLAQVDFTYNLSYNGRNMKLMEPDIYFPTGQPCPGKMHLVARTGNLARFYIDEPVAPGDEIIVQVKIWGYINDEWEYFPQEVAVIVAE